MVATTNNYEQEREMRIAHNRRMLLEIGVDAAARDFHAQAAQSACGASGRATPRPRQPRSIPVLLHTERRRSSRTEGRVQVNYREDVFYGDIFGDRAPRQRATPTLRALTAEEVEEIRSRHGVQALEAYEQGQGGHEVQGSVDEALAARRAARKPVDSGKGVRIQGGKVYDSKHGLTCHWCRQKTLEDHVTCTHPSCGKGRRMPTTFCANCLRNRHGEDQQAAVEIGQWVCPPCRGTCGPGCVSCCNCGPCRKKLDLEPTRQVLTYARSQGFSNVHDYLVHMVTGESFEAIQARKAAHPWGKWISQPDEEGGQVAQPAVNSTAAAGASDGAGHPSAAAGAGEGAAGPTEEPATAAGAGEGAIAGCTAQARKGTEVAAGARPGRKRGCLQAQASEAYRAVKPKTQAAKGSKHGAC